MLLLNYLNFDKIRLTTMEKIKSQSNFVIKEKKDVMLFSLLSKDERTTPSLFVLDPFEVEKFLYNGKTRCL